MSKYGNFKIHLDSYTYNPGDTVNGIIYLHCITDFPSSSITLKLEGKEKAKWWESHEVYDGTDSEGNAKYRTEYYPVYKSERCYRSKFPIAVFKGPFIPKGQYEVPFTFNLPLKLPSTFGYDWYRDGDCYGRISYSVKALLESSASSLDLLKLKVPFIVNAGLNREIKTQAKKIAMEVTTCCCYQMGTFNMNCYFEKDAYMPNETAYMVVEAQNKAKVDCLSISGKFNQHIYISGGIGTKNTLNEVSIGGLGKGEEFTGLNAKRMQFKLKGVKVDGVTNTSTNGKLVSCFYHVKMEANMDACQCCCDEQPYGDINVLIYNPRMEKDNRVDLPENWDPIRFDMYIANVNDNRYRIRGNEPEYGKY